MQLLKKLHLFNKILLLYTTFGLCLTKIHWKHIQFILQCIDKQMKHL